MVDRDKRADDEAEDEEPREDEAEDEERSEASEDEADEGDEGEGPGPDEGDEDGRAAAVAKSLGVREDEDAAAADKAEAEAPKNRAARRRERALERRARRGAVEGEGEEPAAEPAGAAAEPAGAAAEPSKPREPERDRNKRLREELLARRRAAAKQGAAAAAPVQQGGLTGSEVAEDLLVRATAKVTRFVSKHRRAVGYVLLGAVAAAGAILYYVYRVQTVTAAAADLLTKAAVADQSPVVEPTADTRTPEQKADDPRTFFPSAAERGKAALEAYDKVMAEHSGTGAAMLAQLGKAGVLLEQQQWDEATKAYDAVLASQLAPADADVKARALEGLGFAKEGKGDVDGALAAFGQLEPMAGFKALALYHRARLLYGKKNQPEEAKKLVLEAREALEKGAVEARASGGEASSRWLMASVEALLAQIDPKAVPPKPAHPGPEMTQEQLRKLLEQKGLAGPGQAPPPEEGGQE